MNQNLITTLAPANAELLESACSLLDLSGSSREQFRRYVGEHLAWCQAEALSVPVGDADRERYRRHLQQTGKVQHERAWRVRAVYLNKLPGVVAELERRRKLASQRRRTRLIDALPATSPLALAIAEILNEVSVGYRRSLRADLALVLEWCSAENVDPTGIGPSELARLRRSLRSSGRRSEGPMVAARRLHRAFYRPEAWWQ